MLKKLSLIILTPFLLSSCEKVDSEKALIENLEGNAHAYEMQKNQDFLYNRYLSKLNPYLTTLMSYQSHKVYPNQVKPDEYFLQYLNNAIHYLDVDYNIKQCDLTRFTSEEIKAMKKGEYPLRIKQDYFMYRYESIVPDFPNKDLMIEAFLNKGKPTDFNQIELKDEIDRISLAQIKFTNNESETYRKKAIFLSQPEYLFFNPKAIYCISITEDDVKNIQSNFDKLYLRYPLLGKDAQKIGLPNK